MTHPLPCKGCGTYHPDLHLPPKEDNVPTQEATKTLAMDDRDIRELIAMLNDRAGDADTAGDRFSRGYAAGVLLAVDSLSRYIARVAS